MKNSFDYLLENAKDCLYYGYGFKSFCNLNSDALNEIGIEKMREYWQKAFKIMSEDF